MSLIGKADPTLVQGAFAAGQAKVPGDMSKIYQQRAANVINFTKGMQQAWELRNKEETALHEKIKGWQDETLTNVTTGKTNDALMGLTDGVVNNVYSELKNLEPGSLEFKKKENEITRFAALIKQNNTTFNSLIGADLIDQGTGDEVRLWEAMLDDYNNNGNKCNAQYKDGDIIYTLPGTDISMSLSEVQKRMGTKDATGPTNIMNSLVALKGNIANRKWDDSYAIDFKNEISGYLDNPNDRKNIMTTNFPGMKHTFFEALTGKDPKMQAEIFDILDGLGTVDVDKDGNVDTKEELMSYANPENGYLLTQAIANSPEGKDMLANYIVENVAQDIYRQGEKELAYQNRKSGDGTTTTTTTTTPEEVDYSNITDAIARKDFKNANVLSKGVRTVRKGDTGWLLGGLKGSEKGGTFPTQIVPFDHPDVDQILMNHYTGGGVEYSRPIVDVNEDGIEDSKQPFMRSYGQVASPNPNITGFDVKSLTPNVNKEKIRY